MPNVASVLKEEIRRLARKEARILTRPLKKALAVERKQVAALRKQLGSLSQESRRAARAAVKAAEPAAANVSAALAGWRKDTVRSTRRLLGITQGQLAKLIGVNPISVSFWETGRSTPRAKTQARVLEVRKLSKDEAHGRLGASGGSRGPRRRRKAAAQARASAKSSRARRTQGASKARARRAKRKA